MISHYQKTPDWQSFGKAEPGFNELSQIIIKANDSLWDMMHFNSLVWIMSGTEHDPVLSGLSESRGQYVFFLLVDVIL